MRIRSIRTPARCSRQSRAQTPSGEAQKSSLRERCPMPSGRPQGADSIPDVRPCCQRVDGIGTLRDRKSTRLNSSHVRISYAVFCLKKKKKKKQIYMYVMSYKSQEQH